MATETALITGASTGIGRELALLFARDGAKLVLVARNTERLQELAAELRDRFGSESLVLSEDLSDVGAPKRILDQLATKNIDVDVLVNNAGFGAVGEIAQIGDDKQADMIKVNVLALAELTRAMLPGMIARRRGGVLNVGSTAGFQPGPYMAVYYATKAFVLSYTEALAEEVSGAGVKVTCLCPGPTATEFARSAKMEDTLLFNMGSMSAAKVAKVGYRGFRRGRVIVIPGVMNKFGAMAVRFVPRIVARKFTKRLQQPAPGKSATNEKP
jgi:short-subunit dehydrogenase